MRCLVYIDLNMVRVGAVRHPSEWACCGYNESQNPRQRYSLIDQEVLSNVCVAKDSNQLREDHRQWVEQAINSNNGQREPNWSEALAVGNKDFTEEIKKQLGYNAQGRNIEAGNDEYVLQEARHSYSTVFNSEKVLLSQGKGYFCDV